MENFREGNLRHALVFGGDELVDAGNIIFYFYIYKSLSFD
jgi:hypothetical protein